MGNNGRKTQRKRWFKKKTLNRQVGGENMRDERKSNKGNVQGYGLHVCWVACWLSLNSTCFSAYELCSHICRILYTQNGNKESLKVDCKQYVSCWEVLMRESERGIWACSFLKVNTAADFFDNRCFCCLCVFSQSPACQNVNLDATVCSLACYLAF